MYWGGGKEDRDGRPILHHLPFLSREFLEAPGADTSCLYIKRAPAAPEVYCHRPDGQHWGQIQGKLCVLL